MMIVIASLDRLIGQPLVSGGKRPAELPTVIVRIDE